MRPGLLLPTVFLLFFLFYMAPHIIITSASTVSGTSTWCQYNVCIAVVTALPDASANEIISGQGVDLSVSWWWTSLTDETSYAYVEIDTVSARYSSDCWDAPTYDYNKIFSGYVDGFSASYTYAPPPGSDLAYCYFVEEDDTGTNYSITGTPSVAVIPPLALSDVTISPSGAETLTAGESVTADVSWTGEQAPYDVYLDYGTTPSGCTDYVAATDMGVSSMSTTLEEIPDIETSGTYYFCAKVVGSLGTDIISKPVEVTAIGPPPNIDSFDLPENVVIGEPISIVSSVSGGTPPYDVRINQCPDWDSCSPGIQVYNGKLDSSGSTLSTSVQTDTEGTTAGTEYFQETVTDTAKTNVESSIVAVEVTPPNSVLSIDSFDLPENVVAGQPIPISSSVSGGTAPYYVQINECLNLFICTGGTQVYSNTLASSGSAFTANVPTSSTGYEYFQETVTDSASPTSVVTSEIANVLVMVPANVLIVTAGEGDQTPSDAIQAYQDMLNSEGLNSIYVELDSPKYNSLTGTSLPVGTGWQSTKTAINTLEMITGAQYVIILGDATVVPMPSVAASGPLNILFQITPTTNTPSGLGLSTAVVPTDDPYGEIGTETFPSVIVARMPGSTGGQIGKILQNAVDVRSDGNTEFGAVVDNFKYPNSMSAGNFLDFGILEGAKEFLSASGQEPSCAFDGPVCFYAPYYCAGFYNPSSEVAQILPCSPLDLESFMQTRGIQYYGCHGSGWDCGGPSSDSEMILSVPTLYATSLTANPVIITSACLDAEIPGTALYPALQNYYPEYADLQTALAQQMLADGASVYIGSTVEFAGGEPYLGSMYANFVNGGADQPLGPVGGGSIGEALYAAKRSMEMSDDNDVVDLGKSMQLYGDPTLTYSKIGSQMDTQP
jgi:hypothetical protein